MSENLMCVLFDLNRNWIRCVRQVTTSLLGSVKAVCDRFRRSTCRLSKKLGRQEQSRSPCDVRRACTCVRDGP